MQGLAAKAKAEGVRIVAPAPVTDLHIDGGAVAAVETAVGTVQCDELVVGVGPWVPRIWEMLGLPASTDVLVDGELHTMPSFHYWALQEGTLVVDPGFLVDNKGNEPSVIHVDTDAPLYDDAGKLVTDQPWGLYYKPDAHFGGVQGGFMPLKLDKPYDEVAVDPYGPASPDFAVDDDFRHRWAAGLSHCQKRFEGLTHKMSPAPSGGIGAFHARQLPGVRSLSRQCVRHCRLEPWLQDDRRPAPSSPKSSWTSLKRYSNRSVTPATPLATSTPVSNSPYPWS